MREKLRDEARLLHIIGMGHYLVHGYYQISADETWNTIKNDLPVLKERVDKYLKEYCD